MGCVVIGVPVREGTGRNGADAGPQALRAAGIREALQRAGHSVEDVGNLQLGSLPDVSHANAALKALPEVAAWTTVIHDAVVALPRGRVPVILGGDHSIALGTLSGLARRAASEGRPLFVLWIDAHPDCHTLDSTQSGHLHGTPVAYALGESGFGGALPMVDDPVVADSICMLGIRSIDPAEAKIIARRGIDVVCAADVASRGIAAVLAPFLERVRAANGLLHVSFDADAVDPAFAPGVGTPVAGGLSVEDAHTIMAMVQASGLLSSLELVELNPFLDRGQRTARLLVGLAAAALGQASASLQRRA
jgi:arginase